MTYRYELRYHRVRWMLLTVHLTTAFMHLRNRRPGRPEFTFGDTVGAKELESPRSTISPKHKRLRRSGLPLPPPLAASTALSRLSTIGSRSRRRFSRWTVAVVLFCADPLSAHFPHRRARASIYPLSRRAPYLFGYLLLQHFDAGDARKPATGSCPFRISAPANPHLCCRFPFAIASTSWEISPAENLSTLRPRPGER